MPIGRASCRTISTAFECERLDLRHHHLGDCVRAEPGPVGRSLHLKVPKAALEQKENIVRWSCTRCSPPLRATVGPARVRSRGFFQRCCAHPYLWAMPSASYLPLWRTSALLHPIEIGPELLAVQDNAKREQFQAE